MTSFFAPRSACSADAAEPSCSRCSTADCSSAAFDRGIALDPRPGRQLGQRGGEGVVDGVVDALHLVVGEPGEAPAGDLVGGARSQRHRQHTEDHVGQRHWSVPVPTASEHRASERAAATGKAWPGNAADRHTRHDGQGVSHRRGPPANWGNGLADSAPCRAATGSTRSGTSTPPPGGACSPGTGAVWSTTTARSSATTAAPCGSRAARSSGVGVIRSPHRGSGRRSSSSTTRWPWRRATGRARCAAATPTARTATQSPQASGQCRAAARGRPEPSAGRRAPPAGSRPRPRPRPAHVGGAHRRAPAGHGDPRRRAPATTGPRRPDDGVHVRRLGRSGRPTERAATSRC